MSNALNGSEDEMISASHDAGRLWQEMNMPSARLQAIDEVNALIASGELESFEDWQKVVKHPADPGVKGLEGDGSEFERGSPGGGGRLAHPRGAGRHFAGRCRGIGSGD